jgi:flagellar biosynthesis GTPase FlhF
MSLTQETTKNINRLLEKIMDDLGEALVLMRNQENGLSEEMGSLFSVKRRMIDLVQSCFKIYQELVVLRFQKTEEHKKEEKEELNVEKMFKDVLM